MSDDDSPNAYDDRHRAFLQAFMSRGTLTFSEAQPLLAAIKSAHAGRTLPPSSISEGEFQSYITAVSRAVSAFDYEVRSTQPQTTSASGPSNGRTSVRSAAVPSNATGAPERVYALINATSDALTQLATTLTPDELAFVKRVLDAMFERNNTLRREACCVGGKAALQLHGVRGGGNSATQRRRTAEGQTSLTQGDGNEDTNANTNGTGAAHSITMSQAQTVLDALVSQGWFEVSRRGNYSLTPRALMELRGWLAETYNDEDEAGGGSDDDDDEDDDRPRLRIKTCAACKEIVTVGLRCPRIRCIGRLHDACTERYFTMQQAERCPVCKGTWDGCGYVGERAIPGNAGPARTSMNGTQATPARGAAGESSMLNGSQATQYEGIGPQRSTGARPGRRRIVAMDGASEDADGMDEDDDDDDD